MDFAMLGILVLGSAFVFMNIDTLGCTFNPNGPNCGGIVPGPDCTVEPDAVGCGGGGGSGSGSSECGKLCRDKKCSDYKSSCKSGCKYCCDSGPQSPKCSGTAGSQCSSLCSSRSCATYVNQCEGACVTSAGCTYCNNQAQTLVQQIIAARPTGSIIGCGCATVSGRRVKCCELQRKCNSGALLTSACLSLGVNYSVSKMISALNASYNSKHPSGCSGATGGCTRKCTGGYVLDSKNCTCVCNANVKNCTSSSKCLVKSNTQCACGTINCPSGKHQCRGSGGTCQCCTNTTPKPSGCPGTASGGSCTWDCKNAYCWKGICKGKTYKACLTGQSSNRTSGCNNARSWFLNRCSAGAFGYTQAYGYEDYPKVAGAYAGQAGAGPFGDYRYVQTLKVPPPMFAGRTQRR